MDVTIIASDIETEKLDLKEKFRVKFEMKDVGKPKYFLGNRYWLFKKGIFHLPKKI